jgi:hypothetical protein
VAFFFKAGGPQGGDRIFTNNLTDPTKSFQINTANEGLVMSVDPNIEGGPDTERTLFVEDSSGPDFRLSQEASGWFHIVASTHGDTGPERAANYKLWVNGVDRTANLVARTTGWGVNTEFAKIGGREPDPLHTTTHPGAQDEVAIWLNRVLTDAEAMSLWTAATTVPTQGPPFVMTSSRNAANGDITLKFPSVDGAVYAVDRSTDLSNWTALTSSLQGTGSELTFVDDSDEGHAARRFYYRARKLP